MNSKTDRARPEVTLTVDRPIADKGDDLLNRASFVARLSRAITTWRGDDSAVIGIYGPWGSGKSSVKNLLLEQIRKDASKSVEVIEFNPWHWTGHEDVTKAFFREVLVKLKGRRGEHAALAKKLKQYAEFLGVSATALDGVKRLVTWILAFGGFSSLALSAYVSEELVGTVGVTLAAGCVVLAAALAFAEKFLQKIADWLDASGTATERSLEESKRAVSDALRSYEKTFLVVIDDIDRLSADEIRTVFRLIRANADFPRFAYLVLFQRDIVEKALMSEGSGDGAKFLEKIIQVSVPLPPASRGEIDKVLSEGLNAVFAKDIKKLDSTYWDSVYRDGLQQYFTNLREVKRFIGLLDFTIGFLRGEGVLEVNPVDFVAIEALSLFEPSLYDELRDSRELMTNIVDDASRDRSSRLNACKALLRHAPEARQAALGMLFRHLFPPVAEAFGGPKYRSDSRDQWLGDLRVCSSEIFGRYFQKSLPPNDLSQAEVNRLFEQTADRIALAGYLKNYASDGRLMTVLERLIAGLRAGQRPLALSGTITALFDAGDYLPKDQVGFFSLPTHWTLLRLIKVILGSEESDAFRTTALISAVTSTDCVGMAVLYVGHEIDASEGKVSVTSEQLDEETVRTLKRVCVERLREKSRDGTLAGMRYLGHALYRWEQWASIDEVRIWAAQLVAAPQGALALLKALLGTSTSHSIETGVQTRYYVKLKNVEHFVDLVLLEQVTKELLPSSLSELDRQALEAFRFALERRRAGDSEDMY